MSLTRLALFGLLALSLMGVPARAEDAPGGVRVERRVLVKKNHLLLSGGLGWFARGDYYNSPGLTISAAYYPVEWGGIDLRVAGFYSYLNTGASEIFSRYQSLPDAQQPRALALIGWRQSLAYGKLLLADSLGSTVHFDLQATAHVGSVITNKSANPAGSIGLAIVARIARFNLQFDLPFVISREVSQTSSVAMGVLPMVSFGASL